MAWTRDANIYAVGPNEVSPPPASADRTSRGFTLFEVMVVLALSAALLALAAPRLLDSSGSVALINAQSRVSSAVSLTRTSAMRHGRVAYLVLDVAMDRVRVDIDTSLVGDRGPVTVHSLDLWETLAVDLRSSEPLLCFDSRGLSVTKGACPGTGAVIYFYWGQEVDSLVVSSTGRILP